MHLSDAIILGHPLKLSESMTYISTKRRVICGCAIGGALLAVTPPELWPTLVDLEIRDFFDRVEGEFPWLQHPSVAEDRITSWYYAVHKGDMTIDTLADNVRLIEPDCGVCNQYICTCSLTCDLESRNVDFSFLDVLDVSLDREAFA